MRIILHFFLCGTLLHLSLVALSAKTRLTAETSALEGLPGDINIYAAMQDGQLPESWHDLIEVLRRAGDNTRYDRYVRSVRDGRNLSELYSFIAPEDRAKFPHGELILVRHVPLANPSPRIGGDERWFLGRTPQGGIGVTAWDEERFQAMLAETGIAIPPPQPLPPEPPPPRSKQEPPSQHQPPAMEPIEEQLTPPDALRVPEPPVEQPEQPPSDDEPEDSGNRSLLWLVAAVLGLLALWFAWHLKRRGSHTE